ncbi:MAG: TlpA disulfide reductase family protein [Balneolaceae bacterium]|nr:TlpA disulfide reductase family protein [Balneolaceae bacterium]
MKLDPKYFIPFLAIVAIATALIITFFTISSQKGQRQAFERAIMQQDSLKMEQMKLLNADSTISVKQFEGKFVLLDFWATWSNFSEGAHVQVAEILKLHPDTLHIIAAVVEDKGEKVISYIERNKFPFDFVNGTRVFNQYQVPGLPTQLLYNPSGEIIDVYFGSADSTQYDSLRLLLNNGD